MKVCRFCGNPTAQPGAVCVKDACRSSAAALETLPAQPVEEPRRVGRPPRPASVGASGRKRRRAAAPPPARPGRFDPDTPDTFLLDDWEDYWASLNRGEQQQLRDTAAREGCFLSTAAIRWGTTTGAEEHTGAEA